MDQTCSEISGSGEIGWSGLSPEPCVWSAFTPKHVTRTLHSLARIHGGGAKQREAQIMEVLFSKGEKKYLGIVAPSVPAGK